MTSKKRISKLRVLVGYLGEHTQSRWWQSSFLGVKSSAFLCPTFGRSTAHAQAAGVTEAARRVHDEAIGVGCVFHLFRLPEQLEQDLRYTLPEAIETVNARPVADALEELEALGSRDVAGTPGPAHIGPVPMLNGTRWVSTVASHYHAAFAAGHRSFPYFSG